MPDAPPHSHEPHPWAGLAPDQVLARVTYDLYGPVSALGTEIDRLSSGSFEDEELLTLLGQIREATNQLGKLVVLLKRYSSEHPPDQASSPINVP